MDNHLVTLLKENRTFAPSAEFKKQARFGDVKALEEIRQSAEKDPVRFWEDAARDLHWFKPWSKALEWKEPFADWFVGGTLNVAYNCLDRQLAQAGDRPALIWEGEDGSTVQLTFRELHAEVCRLANAMESRLKLKAGDCAAIYLPLIPEAVIAMLACARVGVTHTVIFAGFSQSAIHDRALDANCRVVFTCDVSYRRGQALPLQPTVAAGVADLPQVEHVVVLRRKKDSPLGRREVDWKGLVEKEPATHQAKPMPSGHPLFILYTSGTTGKPKGIVHSSGGYLTGVTRTAKWVFDLKTEDRYWCTADIGWITGHSYIVYGMLANGITNVIFEGAINYPTSSRIWEMIERHRVTVLYTAPTAIRACMREGEAEVGKHSMASLRLLGSVGEPINPEAWIWYYTQVGKGRCPIVDTWWQTETGSILIAPVPGAMNLKPGSATRPFPGIVADVVDEKGNSCPADEGGYLVIRHPWPAMMQAIHRDPERLKEQYWSRFPGCYFTGDGAHRDADGYFWIKGRVDDVINVSGHRLGTMEIESALVSHPLVAEAAVVGAPHELKGQAIVAFVIPKVGAKGMPVDKITSELKQHVVKEIGALARPEEIHLTRALPKTRSGKIMRRLLRDVAAGKNVSGDTTTLENSNLLDPIKDKV